MTWLRSTIATTVGGTLSTQWLPGTNNFETRLRPNIADADVIIISVGGNDITNSLDDALSNIDQAIADTYDLVSEIVENIREMAKESAASIQTSTSSIVCMWTTAHRLSSGDWHQLPRGYHHQHFKECSRTGTLRQGNHSWLFGASEKLEDSLDNYLYDALHFNDKERQCMQRRSSKHWVVCWWETAHSGGRRQLH